MPCRVGSLSARRGAELEPAFLLHARAYRDTSLLLEVLGREHGRVGLVARGVRVRRSRLAGILQPFQPLAISWQARGELGTLTGAESAGRPLILSGRRLVSGFYANELLLRLLGREDAHAGLFNRYGRLLDELAGTADEAVALRGFERDLLGALGYGLPLTQDVAGEPVVSGQWYRYDPGRGVEPVRAGARESGLVAGETLLALAADRLDEATARAARDLMRAALRPHLGSRPLKSRELYARYPTTGEDSDGSSPGQP